MPVKLVLIHKNGSIKDTTVKTFKLAELYKKCKFRNDSDFVGRATWKNGDNFVTLFAKDSGRAGGRISMISLHQSIQLYTLAPWL